MNTYEEKLSILSELIRFAKVDDVVKKSEYNFLLDIAWKLEIEKEVFDDLFENESKHIILKSQFDRIVQFHRLVLLMNVDNEQHQSEINRLHDIGLSMGLPPAAISKVFELMNQYQDKIVPPDVLINIFKAYYN